MQVLDPDRYRLSGIALLRKDIFDAATGRITRLNAAKTEAFLRVRIAPDQDLIW